MTGDQMESAVLILEWDSSQRDAAEWSRILLRWLGICADFDVDLAGWKDLYFEGALTPDVTLLTVRMRETGSAEVYGTTAERGLAASGWTTLAGGEAGFKFSVLDELEPTGRATLSVPEDQLRAWSLTSVLTFVGASAELFGCRWACWKTQPLLEAMLQAREMRRDHQGWVTYWAGVTPQRLGRLRPPAEWTATQNGVVVGLVADPLDHAGAELQRLARRVERQLFGIRGAAGWRPRTRPE